MANMGGCIYSTDLQPFLGPNILYLTPLPFQRDFDVDPVVAGRPVVLQSRDGHAIWVSRKALDDNAPYPDDIDGGVIFRDDEGNPTGASCRTGVIVCSLILMDRCIYG